MVGQGSQWLYEKAGLKGGGWNTHRIDEHPVCRRRSLLIPSP